MNNVLNFLKANQTRTSVSAENPNRSKHLILGGLCLFWGLSQHKGGTLRTLAGALLIACGILDVNPMQASSIAMNKMGTKDNLFNLVKSFLPGPGVNPKYTDQASPQNHKNGKNTVDTRSLREMLSIG